MANTTDSSQATLPLSEIPRSTCFLSDGGDAAAHSKDRIVFSKTRFDGLVRCPGDVRRVSVVETIIMTVPSLLPSLSPFSWAEFPRSFGNLSVCVYESVVAKSTAWIRL